MPAPDAEALSTSAKQNFASKRIALPMQWRSMGSHYPDAFNLSELSTPVNPPDNLFHEPTVNKYHTQAARTLGRGYEIYIDGICAAVADAIAKWMQSASIVSVTLAGTIGTVRPDATIGPALEPLILTTAPQATRQEQRYSLAVATALGDNWALWQSGLCGVLAYPPFGPPGPNIPAPLISFGSAGEANLAPHHLCKAMARQLDEPGALHAQDLFHSLALAFYAHFQIFKANTIVSGVIMTPPVPPPPEPSITEALRPESFGPLEPDPESVSGEALATAEAIADKIEPKPIPGGIVIPTPGNFI
jgi:hypothetical protein